MNIRQILLYWFFILLVLSCRNRTLDTKSNLVKDSSTGFEQLEELKEVYYRFPSPDEMLSFFDREELLFNDAVLSPVDNARSYLDSKSQALNLGIYIADLAYITLFQRQKEALTCFTVVYGLSDKLRIASAFDPVLMKRFEENLSNIDSLKTLTDEAMTDITNYLVKNNKEKTFAIISIGGFIESMYLAFHLAGDFEKDNLIIQRISDQKMVLENLIGYSLEHADDQNVEDAIKLLYPMREVFNELNIVTEETSTDKTDGGKLIIKGGEKISITKDQYNKLRDITFDTRKLITENLEN